MAFPVWIKNYQRGDFKPDLIAGLTVGVMLIPQAMAYAMLAGLPPIYGLYASTVPLIIYALFGTSRHLSVGPVAIDPILIVAGISAFALAGSDDYISLTITLALMVGFIQFSLGVLKLGFLVNFLSHPVITGFTSAAAIIIGLSQLKNLLSIDITSNQYLQDIIASLIQQSPNIHWLTFLIGAIVILFLILFKRFFPKFPAALFMLVMSILAVSIFHLEAYGVKIIGEIPGGLPRPGLPFVDLATYKKLLPTAFALALLSFMESTAIARALQAKHKTYKIIPNKELMALGLANMLGSIFKSFPVSGGFSRSTLNEQSGARTNLSSIISACVIILTLLFLTPLFYYLPRVILASIIIVAVSRLINFKEAKNLWHIDWKDFLMMLVTFLGTLFLGIGEGIGIGVALSLAWIVFEASYPHYAELGRIPGTQTFRNVKRYNDVEIASDVLIFRFDAPLFFANIDRFRELLLSSKAHRKEKINTIIIDMESNNTVDSSALVVLSDMWEELKKENIRLMFTEVKGPVRDKFLKSGLTLKIGEENFFMEIDDALNALTNRFDSAP
ncbi:MAG: solute carrier family 26 protein [Saprospiraceae bacterium]|uniref:Solute carrier family 26 protein n=1 Tax=Candidatus Opimibacter skivensis TaxID=2982028 RepID=A0A9D7XNB0_9BACT|nr:solute carrier family 26 protein [Candidatus Opimibacter skivensis]